MRIFTFIQYQLAKAARTIHMLPIPASNIMYNLFRPQDEVAVEVVEAVEVTGKVAGKVAVEGEEGGHLAGVVEEEGEGVKRETEMIVLEGSVIGEQCK